MKYLKSNYGFIIIFFILLIYFFTLLVFVTCSFKKLKKEIKNIILALKFNKIPTKKNITIKKNPVIIKRHEKEMKNNFIKNKIDKLTKKKMFSKFTKKENKKNNSSNSLLVNIYNSGLKIKPIKNEKIDYNNNSYNKFLKKKDFELNSLEYKEAIKLDRRNYFQYYTVKP